MPAIDARPHLRRMIWRTLPLLLPATALFAVAIRTWLGDASPRLVWLLPLLALLCWTGLFAALSLTTDFRPATPPPAPPPDLHLGRTATGLPKLRARDERGYDDFLPRAQAIVDRFSTTDAGKIDGSGVRMWITHIGPDSFCISWDDWVAEDIVMPWQDTFPKALERLLSIHYEAQDQSR